MDSANYQPESQLEVDERVLRREIPNPKFMRLPKPLSISQPVSQPVNNNSHIVDSANYQPESQLEVDEQVLRRDIPNPKFMRLPKPPSISQPVSQPLNNNSHIVDATVNLGGTTY